MEFNSPLKHCELRDDGKSLFVNPGRSALSPRLNQLESVRSEIQALLRERELKTAYILRGEGQRPYQILAAPPSIFSVSGVEFIGRSNPTLARSLEPLLKADAEGEIITIVSMVTDKCKHSNVPPKRGLRLEPNWTGYDYRQSWKLDGINLSQEYKDLIKELYDDRVVPDYEYDLIRPDDGARLRYSTSYTLIDFFGELVRVGVSREEDFTLIESGRSDRVIK